MFAESTPPFITIIASLISGFSGVIITGCIAWYKRKSQLSADIKAIKEQLYPNGGSSLRDAVNRIEEQQHVDGELRRAYQHHITVPLWEADAEGHILWSNQAFARLLGVTTEELKGHGWLSMVNREDLANVKHEILQAGSHDHYIDYRAHRPKPATPIKLRTRWKRVTNHAGKTVRFVGTVIDNQEAK